MNILKKLFKRNTPESDEERLYRTIMTNPDIYMEEDFRWTDLGEGMEAISVLVVDHWKQKFLLDHNRYIAMEVMTDR